MRLVRIGRAVWDVLAILDESANSAWGELEAADPSDSGAERMRITLETEVPLNGPPRMNKTKCRALGDGIYEFKEPGVRVLWFYDAGRTVVCSHVSPKVAKKKFQPEIAKAKRLRDAYLVSKLAGTLKVLNRSEIDR
jgi:hypothetical protein